MPTQVRHVLRVYANVELVQPVLVLHLELTAMQLITNVNALRQSILAVELLILAPVVFVNVAATTRVVFLAKLVALDHANVEQRHRAVVKHLVHIVMQQIMSVNVLLL